MRFFVSNLVYVVIFVIGVVIETGYSRPKICTADKYANGCSVPLGMELPYKEQFTPACNKHDLCYGCGHHYNWTREDCDWSFNRDMKAICKKLHHWRSKRFIEVLLDFWNFFRKIENGESRCEMMADLFYEGVHLFADSHFERVDHEYCSSWCAREHAHPNISVATYNIL